MNNEPTSDTSSNEKNMRPELGALWKKEGRNQTYLTGYISNSAGERLNIVIFSSKTKKNPNQPDYRIFESLPPKNQGDNSDSKPEKKVAVSAPNSKKADASNDDDEQLM